MAEDKITKALYVDKFFGKESDIKKDVKKPKTSPGLMYAKILKGQTEGALADWSSKAAATNAKDQSDTKKKYPGIVGNVR